MKSHFCSLNSIWELDTHSQLCWWDRGWRSFLRLALMRVFSIHKGDGSASRYDELKLGGFHALV
jgi:hypothetical protein